MFTGHLHKNRIFKYKNITNITVSSIGVPLGEDPSGYYVVDYSDKNLNYEFISLGDLMKHKLYKMLFLGFKNKTLLLFLLFVEINK